MKIRSGFAVLCAAALVIGVISLLIGDPAYAGHIVTAGAIALPASLRPATKIPGPHGIVNIRAEASPELKTLVEQLNRTVAEFKSSNDQEIAELKRGQQDVVRSEQVDRINTEVTNVKTRIDEIIAKISALSIGSGGDAEGAKDLRANVRKFLSAHAGRRVALANVTNEHVERYEAYKDAFATLLTHNLTLESVTPEVRAALSVGIDRDGGFLVPTEQSMELERRIYETSPMRQISRVITIGTGAWEAPYKSSQATSGGWVTERGTRSTTATGSIGMQRIDTHEQYAFPEVTQTMLDDGVLDVESFIVQDTEDVMARTENTAFVTGNGSGKPKGFAGYGSASTTTDDSTRTWGILQYVPSGASAGFPDASGAIAGKDPDALITLISKLNPAYRAGSVFAMNRSTEAAIRKLKDGDGRYFIDMGDTRSMVFGHQLFGYPIVNLEDMASLGANSYSLAFGNFRRGYYIVDRAGFRVLRDPYTDKPYVGFYITKRTGGDVRNFDAIKLMKFATS